MRSQLREQFVAYLAKSASVLIEQARTSDPRLALELLSEGEEIRELMQKTSRKKPLSQQDFDFWIKVLDSSPKDGLDAGADLSDGEGLSALTKREREVLTYVTKGYSNKDIAATLGVREITVKVHLKSVYRKLGVANRTQAARVVWEIGQSHSDRFAPNDAVIAQAPDSPGALPTSRTDHLDQQSQSPDWR